LQLLLLNGTCPDYNPPPYLASIEYPRTLYVNLACQCNNPLALAALLQHDAATLDQDFVDWQLANDNEAAILEVRAHKSQTGFTFASDSAAFCYFSIPAAVVNFTPHFE